MSHGYSDTEYKAEPGLKPRTPASKFFAVFPTLVLTLLIALPMGTPSSLSSLGDNVESSGSMAACGTLACARWPLSSSPECSLGPSMSAAGHFPREFVCSNQQAYLSQALR